MSCDACALYAYAAEVQGLPLRDEIKALLNGDDEEWQYRVLDDVLEDFDNGELDGPVYDKLESARWEFFVGPGATKYIGYSAIMPYEQPLMAKEEMDREIYNALAYLCGEKYAEENKPEEVCEAWDE